MPRAGFARGHPGSPRPPSLGLHGPVSPHISSRGRGAGVARRSRRPRTPQSASAQGIPATAQPTRTLAASEASAPRTFLQRLHGAGGPHARPGARTQRAHISPANPCPGARRRPREPAHAARLGSGTRSQNRAGAGSLGGPWGGARWAGPAGSGRVRVAAVRAAPPWVPPLAGFLAPQPPPYPPPSPPPPPEVGAAERGPGSACAPGRAPGPRGTEGEEVGRSGQDAEGAGAALSGLQGQRRAEQAARAGASGPGRGAGGRTSEAPAAAARPAGTCWRRGTAGAWRPGRCRSR